MRARFANRPGRSTLRRLAARREPDQRQRPARGEQRQPELERRAAADDVEGEVDRPFADVGRAEALRLLELALVEVDRADLRGAGDPRALDHREPDRAAADHRDARSLPDLGRLEHRHDAGRDRAADQARLLGRELGRDLHGRDLRHDGVRRERPGAKHGRQLAAVAAKEAPARCRRALALARLAALAHRAPATGGLPAEHDAVADGQPTSTPSPTASTVPAPSCPSSTGYA